MFDNPRDKLHWIEEELFDTEYDGEEETYDEIYGDFGGEFEDADSEEQEWLEELNDLLEEDEEEDIVPLRRTANRAVDFNRTVYDDEEFDESTAVLVEKRSRKKGEKKKKGIKGLIFLAFLEILGILAVIGWWMQWLI